MNKQNKISLILGVLVLTVLIVTSSFAFFQITNTDSSTDTNFSGELEDIEDYGKSVLSGGIEGYHINILASDMAPSKIGTHYYGTIDPDSNYSLERKNYEISNVSIIDGVNNENVEYTCTSELSITLEGSLIETKEDGSYYIQKGDGTLYLSGSKLRIDKRQIDLKELIESATPNEEGIKEYKKTLTYIISKGNPGTLNVDFDIINRDVVQNDIAGKKIEITLRNSNLQCEVSGRKVYAIIDTGAYFNQYVGTTYRSDAYIDKIVSASFVDYVPNDLEGDKIITYWDLSSSKNNSVIGWLEATEENPEEYNLYIGSKDNIYVTYLPYSFAKMTNLKEINFDNLNTSEVTIMEYMFSSDSKLTTLDLSTFDTSSVTDMNSMFYNCSKLTTLDLSTFDTSQVTDMSDMFYECSNLTTLDLSNFDISSVTDMSAMFYDCSNLSSLDLSNFTFDNVTNVFGTFSSERNI